jgi:hypothetical protein
MRYGNLLSSFLTRVPSVAAHLIRCIAVNIKNPETLPTTPNFVSRHSPHTPKQMFGLQGPVIGLIGTKHLQDMRFETFIVFFDRYILTHRICIFPK